MSESQAWVGEGSAISLEFVFLHLNLMLDHQEYFLLMFVGLALEALEMVNVQVFLPRRFQLL